ncbi:tyrosine-protein phosphatase [Streptomyces sp. NPDC101132]|uniref:tyrosine-protein phosphatase n=1 Tax=Streptomyces sp. NPDC101132 TaxID=3366110 RepID=UPI0038153979
MKTAAAATTALALALTAATSLAAATANAESYGGEPGRDHGRPGVHHGHPAAHHPRIPFTEATVTAGADGSYTLKWAAEGVRRVEVRAGGRVVARGTERGEAVVTGLPAADRQWFDFRADHGQPLRLADRLVRLDGTVNLRDAGGYRTSDGRWVRMGEVYRSDALNRLTADDQATLRRLGIRTVFDLRTQGERDKDPDRVPAGTAYTVADVFADSGAFSTMPRTPDEAVRAMIDAEKAMVSSPAGRKAYAQVAEGLAAADARGEAVLFHCTAGKDRTGWAAAALLTGLGVPRATVEADYLASNDYRKAANDALLGHLPPAQAAVYKPLLDVRPEYLNAGYEEVAARYGGFDAYLHDGLGLNDHTQHRLQKSLLTD